jgi:hypothetical protein
MIYEVYVMYRYRCEAESMELALMLRAIWQMAWRYLVNSYMDMVFYRGMKPSFLI